MNNQEAFNKIWERAKDRRKAKETSNGLCSYRAAGGLKCFVGELIPDEEYNPKMERWNVAELRRSGLLPPSLQGLDVDLLWSCQSVHDAFPPDLWEYRLRRVADLYSLTVPE